MVINGRRKSQQKLNDRIERLTQTIAQLESDLSFFEGQGGQAPDGSWVARYQVRQGDKIYWYYKLQANYRIFLRKNGESYSKYQHLGKGGSQEHIDAVIGVLRRTITSEIQKAIDSLKGCLVDIACNCEQESR